MKNFKSINMQKKANIVMIKQRILCIVSIIAFFVALDLCLEMLVSRLALYEIPVDVGYPEVLYHKVSRSNPDILIIGDSTVTCQVLASHHVRNWRRETIDSQMMAALKHQNLFVSSLAMKGATLEDMEQMLHLVLPIHKPKVVIMELNLMRFGAPANGFSRPWLELFEIKNGHYAMRPTYRNWMGEVEAGLNNWLMNHWHFYSYRMLMQNILLNYSLYEKQQLAWSKLNQLFLKPRPSSIAQTSPFPFHHSYRGQMQIVKRMLQYLQENNLQVVIYLTPINFERPDMARLKQLHPSFKSMLHRDIAPFLNESVKFVSPDAFDSTFFYDQAHMNEKGVKQLVTNYLIPVINTFDRL